MATIANVARKTDASASTAQHVLNEMRRVAAHPEGAAIESFVDRLNIMAHRPKAASTTSVAKAIRQRGLRAPKDFPVVGFSERCSRGRPQ